MNRSGNIAPSYLKALRFGVAIQLASIVLSGFLLDGGAVAQFCILSLAVYWPVAVLIIWRRPQRPTRTDLSFLRTGYLVILFVSVFLMPFIWRPRGVL